MLKLKSFSLLVSLVIAETIASVLPTLAHSKPNPNLRVWKISYSFCVTEKALKLHFSKWPDQPLVNSQDGKCVRSFKPFFVYGEEKPSLALLYNRGSRIRSDERFKRDSYRVAFSGNGCLPNYPSDFGWHSANHRFSFHATYSNQTPIIPVRAQVEEVPEDAIYPLLQNLLNQGNLLIPSRRSSCQFLRPVINQPNSVTPPSLDFN